MVKEIGCMLWCTAVERPVEIVLERAGGASSPSIDYVPTGWRVKRCLDRGAECLGQKCPLLAEGEAFEEERDPWLFDA